MSRYQMLNTNSDFRRAYARGRQYTTPALVTYVLKNRAGICRIGITTSKKIGIAVERNRARRVIRAAMFNMPEMKAGYDIVFVARRKTVFAKSTEVEAVMREHLLSAGVISDEKEKE